MAEGIVVDLAPVALDEGTHKQEQRGLRLVEVRHQHLHYLVVIAWSDDDLGAAVEHWQVVGIHPRGEGLEAENHGDRHLIRRCACIREPVPMILVGLPLGDVKLIFGEVGVAKNLQAHIVETFQRTDTRGADGNGLSLMANQFGDGLAAHADILGMHLMAFYLLALHRLERTGSYMQREFFTVAAMRIDGL